MTTQNQNYSEKANKLSSELWEMATALRGNIDSSKFKDYIFGIIFYRFLSEKVEAMAKETFEDDGCTYEEACNGAVEGTTAEDVYEYISDVLGYYIKPDLLLKTWNWRLKNCPKIPQKHLKKYLTGCSTIYACRVQNWVQVWLIERQSSAM